MCILDFLLCEVFGAVENESNLTGKLLISMPEMGDPRFHNSVIFLTAHSDDGAMGLIINKPVPKVRFYDLISQMSIKSSNAGPDRPIYFGGPVERERGFVLHSDDYATDDDVLKISSGFAMSATQGILLALAEGNGPSRAVVALGYAGWGPGQLEGEIKQNGWLTADADPAIVFAPNDKDKWTDSLATLGISPLVLSSDYGHA